MTDFEGRLVRQLRDRAESTNVSLDLDAIKARRVRAPQRVRRSVPHGWRVPVVIAASTAAVVLALVALARSRDEVAAPVASPPMTSLAVSPPTVNPYGSLPTEGPGIQDHWHIAYGIDVCGQWMQLEGDLERTDAQGHLTNDAYVATGIHSHDDGIIHLHPFSAAGAGANATLGRFFQNYGIELRDDGLAFDAASGNDALRVAYDRCHRDGIEPVVVAWPDIERLDENVVVRHGLAGVPLGADRIALALAFTDDPSKVDLPPSAVIDLPVPDSLDDTKSVEPEPSATDA